MTNIVTEAMMGAALDAYREGVYLTDEQVFTSVSRIVEAATLSRPAQEPVDGDLSLLPWPASGWAIDRIDELKTALEPFADVSDLIDVETEGFSDDDETNLMFADYLLKSYTIADFRKARSAISALYAAPQPAHGTSATDPAPAVNALGLSEDQISAVLQLVESRLCIIWAQVGAREAFVNELRVLQPISDDEEELCTACDVPFEDGDMVYWNSDDTGHLHADCCGPERESYVNADGAPLKDGEPIPEPFAWRPGR